MSRDPTKTTDHRGDPAELCLRELGSEEAYNGITTYCNCHVDQANWALLMCLKVTQKLLSSVDGSVGVCEQLKTAVTNSDVI